MQFWNTHGFCQMSALNGVINRPEVCETRTIFFFFLRKGIVSFHNVCPFFDVAKSLNPVCPILKKLCTQVFTWIFLLTDTKTRCLFFQNNCHFLFSRVGHPALFMDDSMSKINVTACRSNYVFVEYNEPLGTDIYV